MQCNDDIRDKMGPTPSDAEVSCSLFLCILSTQRGGLRQMDLPVFVMCALCLMAGTMVILPEVLCGLLQVFQAFAR